MASPFDVFDRDFALRRVSSPTSGHYDAQDRWVAPAVTQPPPTIKGHLSTADRLNREHQWGPPGSAGVIETGQLRFFTETLLQEGDVIEADQENGVVFRYRVLGMVRPHRFMAKVTGKPVRYEYDIREVPR